VKKAMYRTPNAKRRFNLLREGMPSRPAALGGLPFPAALLFFVSILAAGIWQIRSGRNPGLTQPQLLSGLGQITEAGAALPDPFSERSLPLTSTMPRSDSSTGGKEADGRMEAEEGGTEMQASLSGPLRGPPEETSTGGLSKAKDRTPRRPVRRSRAVEAGAEVYFRKAQGYYKGKNFEMADAMYRRVLIEEPGHRDALFHLSSIYMEQSRFAEAYPLLRELVDRRPYDPEGLANLAVAEIALGRPEKAVAHLDKALTLEDPPRFKIYLHQGVALSKLERLEEALAWYRKSEELDPGHGHLLFNMAVTYDRLGRYDEALDSYARFLRAGESSSTLERRQVEARIGVLVSYLVREPSGPSQKRAN
jgi:tetratricopeptide (TPR) repeat protein